MGQRAVARVGHRIKFFIQFNGIIENFTEARDRIVPLHTFSVGCSGRFRSDSLYRSVRGPASLDPYRIRTTSVRPSVRPSERGKGVGDYFLASYLQTKVLDVNHLQVI